MKKWIALALVILLAFGSGFGALADSVRIKEGSNPNVRSKPSSDGEVLGNAKSGQTYELVDESDNWLKIRLNDRTEGWIAGGMAERIKGSSGSSQPSAKQTETPKPTPAPEPDRELNQDTAVSFYVGDNYTNKDFLIYREDDLSVSGRGLTMNKYGLFFIMDVYRNPGLTFEFRILPETVAINGVSIRGMKERDIDVWRRQSMRFSEQSVSDFYDVRLYLQNYGFSVNQTEWIEFQYEIKITAEGQNPKVITDTIQFAAVEFPSNGKNTDGQESKAVKEARMTLGETDESGERPLIWDQKGIRIYVGNVDYRWVSMQNGHVLSMILEIEDELGTGWRVSPSWGRYDSEARKTIWENTFYLNDNSDVIFAPSLSRHMEWDTTTRIAISKVC